MRNILIFLTWVATIWIGLFVGGLALGLLLIGVARCLQVFTNYFGWH